MKPIKKLVLLGTGLISGSFALALKRAKLVEQVVGVGRSPENLQRALELGVIDAARQDAASAVIDADFVFIGTPVGQMGALMRAIAPILRPVASSVMAAQPNKMFARCFASILPDIWRIAYRRIRSPAPSFPVQRQPRMVCMRAGAWCWRHLPKPIRP